MTEITQTNRPTDTEAWQEWDRIENGRSPGEVIAIMPEDLPEHIRNLGSRYGEQGFTHTHKIALKKLIECDLEREREQLQKRLAEIDAMIAQTQAR